MLSNINQAFDFRYMKFEQASARIGMLMAGGGDITHCTLIVTPKVLGAYGEHFANTQTFVEKHSHGHHDLLMNL